jgi:hypothetical protein
MLRAAPLALVLALSAAACGGSNTPAPSPTPVPDPATNRAPEIIVATVTPPTGLVWLTTFTAHAEARDADGDALAFAWKNVHGNPVKGAAFNGGADIAFTVSLWPDDEENALSPFTLTVTDGKGGSSSVKVEFAWRVLGGSLVGSIGDQPFSLYVEQEKAILTNGSINGLVNGRDNCAGRSDTSEQGAIDAQGNFQIRFKCKQDLGNLTLVGQFTTDKRLVGTADGAGLRGKPFEFHRPPSDPYEP